MGALLVLNSGSSSIKFAAFDEKLQQILSGSATEIGGASLLQLSIGERAGAKEYLDLPDHAAALTAILGNLETAGIDLRSLKGAGHRVVHGGSSLQSACLVDDTVIGEIERCNELAPLHNPHNLAAIRALGTAAPELPQVVCFDTAFHATNPDLAVRYALPDRPELKDFRRYGFHGISYQGLVSALQEQSPESFPVRLLALHLGNGASLCAIKSGQSVATTMGYSPLEGLTMGTRSGSIDGNLVLRLAGQYGVDEASELLNRNSGLLGLAGMSDMRALHSAGTEAAEFAINHFCYWAVRHVGSMIAAMGGLDGIAFTGGIGENDAQVRQKILSGLDWLGVQCDPDANKRNAQRIEAPRSALPVWIVEAAEEKTIAADALKLLS